MKLYPVGTLLEFTRDITDKNPGEEPTVVFVRKGEQCKVVAHRKVEERYDYEVVLLKSPALLNVESGEVQEISP
jgi:hypothetical protein